MYILLAILLLAILIVAHEFGHFMAARAMMRTIGDIQCQRSFIGHLLKHYVVISNQHDRPFHSKSKDRFTQRQKT